jgi:hypothetical protein
MPVDLCRPMTWRRASCALDAADCRFGAYFIARATASTRAQQRTTGERYGTLPPVRDITISGGTRPPPLSTAGGPDRLGSSQITWRGWSPSAMQKNVMRTGVLWLQHPYTWYSVGLCAARDLTSLSSSDDVPGISGSGNERRAARRTDRRPGPPLYLICEYRYQRCQRVRRMRRYTLDLLRQIPAQAISVRRRRGPGKTNPLFPAPRAPRRVFLRRAR